MNKLFFTSGWSKDEAIREMVDGGYGFHTLWSNIVQYVKDVNVEKIKEGLEKQALSLCQIPLDTPYFSSLSGYTVIEKSGS